MTGKVDFIGIGAPKCGTTWVSECLAEHPQVAFAPEKELYFFCDPLLRRYVKSGFDHYAKGVEWYHTLFPARTPATRVTGEYCPSYMYDTRSCERIRQYRADVKLLVTLRKPVEMIYSWYWYNRNSLLSNLPETFEEFIKIDFLRQIGRYHQFLKPYFEAFPRQHIHVILHDDIKADSPGVLRNLFAFLGIDETFVPEKTGASVNVATQVRFKSVQNAGNAVYKLAKATPGVRAIIASKGFEKFVQNTYRKVNKAPFKYPPMSDAMKTDLLTYYEDDVTALEKLFSRDLAGWKK